MHEMRASDRDLSSVSSHSCPLPRAPQERTAPGRTRERCERNPTRGERPPSDSLARSLCEEHCSPAQ
eukprot:3466848-Prymnesium_polylepis.2